MHVCDTRHLAALATLAHRPESDGKKIYRSLRRIEARAHRANEAACSSQEGVDRLPSEYASIRRSVKRVLGSLPDGFFINGDPRGYALKIDPSEAAVPSGLQKDWGGYGCLAMNLG